MSAQPKTTRVPDAAPAAASAKRGAGGAALRAVHDRRASEVPDRDAPDVDEPRVRPDGGEEPRDRDVRLEEERRLHHQIALRLQREDAPEPRRDRLAVVVLVHEPAD